jgi:HEAT repeat protein
MTRGLLLLCTSWAIAGTGTSQAPAERAWSILEQGAADQNDERRAKAVHALGLVSKSERARKLAESALSDPKPDVRAAAATALGQIGLRGSVAKLKEAVKDSETDVVFSATAALFVLGDPFAHEVYYAVLTGERKTGEALLASQLDRLKDPEALAKIGFEAGVGFVPFGGISYKMFKSIRQDNVSPVRAAAAKRLALDPDPRSGQALAKACSDEKWLVRASAVSAIAERGDKNFVSAVIPLLDDPDDVVRFTAAAATVRLASSGGE